MKDKILLMADPLSSDEIVIDIALGSTDCSQVVALNYAERIVSCFVSSGTCAPVAIDLGSSVHRLLGYVCVDSYLGLREYATPGQLTKIPL